MANEDSAKGKEEIASIKEAVSSSNPDEDLLPPLPSPSEQQGLLSRQARDRLGMPAPAGVSVVSDESLPEPPMPVVGSEIGKSLKGGVLEIPNVPAPGMPRMQLSQLARGYGGMQPSMSASVFPVGVPDDVGPDVRGEEVVGEAQQPLVEDIQMYAPPADANTQGIVPDPYQGVDYAANAYASYGQQPEQGQYQQYQETLSSDLISEIAEQVVSEKLSVLQDRFERVLDFKSVAETRVASIDERLRRIEQIIDRLQLSLLQRVGDYMMNVEDLKQEMEETQKSFKALLSRSGHRVGKELMPREQKIIP